MAENGKTAQDIIREASDLFAQSRNREALAMWETLRQRYPEHPFGYSKGAAASCAMGDYDYAEYLCERGMAKIPQYAELYASYAFTAMCRKDYALAVGRWRAFREKFPSHIWGYSICASCMRELGQPDEGCRLYESALQSCTDRKLVLLEYVGYALVLGRDETVLELCSRLRSEFPACGEGYAHAARIFINRGQCAAAKELCFPGLEAVTDPAKRATLKLLLVNAERVCGNGSSVRAMRMLQNIWNNEKETPDRGAFLDMLDAVAGDLLKDLKNRRENLAASPEIAFYLALALSQKEFLEKMRIAAFLREALANFPRETVYDALDQAIAVYNIHNPTADLLCSDTQVYSRKNALAALIAGGADYLLNLLNIGELSATFFTSVMDEIIESGTYSTYSDKAKYSLARLVNFFDKEKSDVIMDNLVEKVDRFNISQPSGLLAWRKLNGMRMRQICDSLPDPGQKLKIAICISGQLRGYAGCLRNLAASFDLHNHGYDVFVNTWNRIGRKFPIIEQADRVFSNNFLQAYRTVFSDNNYLRLKDHYPEFLRLLVCDDIIDRGTLEKEFATENIIIENDEIDDTQYLTTGDKLHYKIFSCFQMIDPWKYDLVIRMRPDMALSGSVSHNLLECFKISRAEAAIFTVGGLRLNSHMEHGYIIDDNMAIGVPPLVEVYANTYCDMKNIYWPNNAWSCPSRFFGHRNLEYQLFANDIKVVSLKDEITFSDPSVLPIEDIYRAISQDVGGRKRNHEDDLLLAACEKDILLDGS